ncbi:MAG TPA: isoprenylcysteine carboxylmethyltransferase family protein [Tepidiformaceae bacterium]|nr:isoprenylcysteine carboxylmethyltransferase family protein [Tepidiformaceae bacterium]
MPDSLRVPGFIAIGLVLLAYFMAESGRLLLALVRRHRRPPQDHGTLPAIAATFVFSEVAAFAFLLFAPRLDFAGRWWAWQLAGAACVVLGAAIRAAAVRALGEAYSPVVTVTPGQSIVSGGPYRLVRHPAYSRALLLLAGLVASAEPARSRAADAGDAPTAADPRRRGRRQGRAALASAPL